VSLVLCLLVDAYLLLSSAVLLTAGPGNRVDTAFYLLTSGLLLPGALLGARHVAGTLQSAGGPAAVSRLAARATVALLAVLLVSRVARFADIPSSALLLPLSAAWGLGLVLAVRGVKRRGEPSDELGPSGSYRTWSLAAGLGAICLLGFLSPEVFRPVKLGASILIAGSLTAVHLVRPTAGRRLWPIDAVAVGLVVLAVTDLSGYLEYLRPDAVTVTLGDGLVLTPKLLSFIHRSHADFWLGPLNDVLHGRALLVDASSQYGVGSIYFLAAFFKVAPLGYGPLALLASFLTALQYAVAYSVMRLGGCPRTLAVPTITAGVIGLLLGSIGSPADFPSTGGVRFGIPWLVVLLAVSWARWPRARPVLRSAAIGFVAIASVWSFETFVYTSFAFATVVAFEALTLDRGSVRALVRDALVTAACCAAAHFVLALGTRLLAGSWPDWSTYLAFLSAYAGGDELYGLDVDPWSPGLPIFLLLLGSGVALGALLVRRPDLVRERRVLLLAIAATSGLGFASFSYFVGHSHPNTLMYTALPALAAGCLWAALAGDRLAGAPRALSVFVAAAGFWVVALLAISGWPDATDKWRRTALAHALPGAGHGGSIPEAAERLWRSPPSDPRALAAEALLERRLSPGAPALVLVEPELGVETLVRSGRVNVLPFSDPEQENLVPRQADPRVLRAIDGLPSGTLMLTQPSQIDAPVKPTAVPPYTQEGKLVRIQRLALDRIRERFRLTTVERAAGDLMMVRLVSR